jgi:hypothetical protein
MSRKTRRETANHHRATSAAAQPTPPAPPRTYAEVMADFREELKWQMDGNERRLREATAKKAGTMAEIARLAEGDPFRAAAALRHDYWGWEEMLTVAGEVETWARLRNVLDDEATPKAPVEQIAFARDWLIEEMSRDYDRNERSTNQVSNDFNRCHGTGRGIAYRDALNLLTRTARNLAKAAPASLEDRTRTALERMRAASANVPLPPEPEAKSDWCPTVEQLLADDVAD